MNDLLSGYAQGLADYQVIISACLIVFVFFAIGRDISRSLGRVEDELAKIVAAMKQGRRDEADTAAIRQRGLARIKARLNLRTNFYLGSMWGTLQKYGRTMMARLGIPEWLGLVAVAGTDAAGRYSTKSTGSCARGRCSVPGAHRPGSLESMAKY